MKNYFLIFLSLALGFGSSSKLFAPQNATGEIVQIRTGSEHESFDRLLKKYVNERGLVDFIQLPDREHLAAEGFVQSEAPSGRR